MSLRQTLEPDFIGGRVKPSTEVQRSKTIDDSWMLNRKRRTVTEPHASSNRRDVPPLYPADSWIQGAWWPHRRVVRDRHAPKTDVPCWPLEIKLLKPPVTSMTFLEVSRA